MCWCMELDTLRADLGADFSPIVRSPCQKGCCLRSNASSLSRNRSICGLLQPLAPLHADRSPRVSAEGPAVQVLVGVQAGVLHQATRLLEGELTMACAHVLVTRWQLRAHAKLSLLYQYVRRASRSHRSSSTTAAPCSGNTPDPGKSCSGRTTACTRAWQRTRSGITWGR